MKNGLAVATSLPLPVVGRLEVGEEGGDVLKVGARLRVGRDAARLAAPKPLARMHDSLAQEFASRTRLAPVLLEREIELQDHRPERLQFRGLGGVDAVARPDQKAEHKGKQQDDEASDRPDHPLRIGNCLNRQQPLQQEADEPADEGEDGDRRGSRDRSQGVRLPTPELSRLRRGPALSFGK